MRWVPFAVVVLVASSVVAPLGTAAAQTQAPNPCVGTMEKTPDQRTLVSIQGARVTPNGYHKKPAMLVSFRPNGSFEWTRNSSAHGRWWAYDVDPLPNGDLLFATTEGGDSVIGRLDPEENEYVWKKRFGGAPDSERTPQVTDAHDADLINGDELLIADKGEGHERLLVYNLTRDRVVWEWRFENHPERFPADQGGPAHDWTHVNDVEKVGDDWFMASVRNFDQVVFVNRTTREVELTLGDPHDHSILHRQHNPDYLRGPNGEHTVLVADSLNDRVVEYEYDGGEWKRVWAARGFDEPRDADRLPNGNTLVVDRMGHRTVEITPSGKVVWEVYTPYEPYDVERGQDESQGPTMAEVGVSGTVRAHNQARFTTSDVEACAQAMFSFAPSKIDAVVADITGEDVHEGSNGDTGGESNGDGGATDSDGSTGSFPMGAAVVGLTVALVVVAVAVYRRRER
ncbi:MAG: aryl-sulfate sulfotransferase, partial [Haloarculaceae archaeon]